MGKMKPSRNSTRIDDSPPRVAKRPIEQSYSSQIERPHQVNTKIIRMDDDQELQQINRNENETSAASSSRSLQNLLLNDVWKILDPELQKIMGSRLEISTITATGDEVLDWNSEPMNVIDSRSSSSDEFNAKYLSTNLGNCRAIGGIRPATRLPRTTTNIAETEESTTYSSGRNYLDFFYHEQRKIGQVPKCSVQILCNDGYMYIHSFLLAYWFPVFLEDILDEETVILLPEYKIRFVSRSFLFLYTGWVSIDNVPDTYEVQAFFKTLGKLGDIPGETCRIIRNRELLFYEVRNDAVGEIPKTIVGSTALKAQIPPVISDQGINPQQPGSSVATPVSESQMNSSLPDPNANLNLPISDPLAAKMPCYRGFKNLRKTPPAKGVASDQIGQLLSGPDTSGRIDQVASKTKKEDSHHDKSDEPPEKKQKTTDSNEELVPIKGAKSVEVNGKEKGVAAPNVRVKEEIMMEVRELGNPSSNEGITPVPSQGHSVQEASVEPTTVANSVQHRRPGPASKTGRVKLVVENPNMQENPQTVEMETELVEDTSVVSDTDSTTVDIDYENEPIDLKHLAILLPAITKDILLLFKKKTLGSSIPAPSQGSSKNSGSLEKPTTSCFISKKKLHKLFNLSRSTGMTSSQKRMTTNRNCEGTQARKHRPGPASKTGKPKYSKTTPAPIPNTSAASSEAEVKSAEQLLYESRLHHLVQIKICPCRPSRIFSRVGNVLKCLSRHKCQRCWICLDIIEAEAAECRGNSKYLEHCTEKSHGIPGDEHMTYCPICNEKISLNLNEVMKHMGEHIKNFGKEESLEVRYRNISKETSEMVKIGVYQSFPLLEALPPRKAKQNAIKPMELRSRGQLVPENPLVDRPEVRNKMSRGRLEARRLKEQEGRERLAELTADMDDVERQRSAAVAANKAGSKGSNSPKSDSGIYIQDESVVTNSSKSCAAVENTTPADNQLPPQPMLDPPAAKMPCHRGFKDLGKTPSASERVTNNQNVPFQPVSTNQEVGVVRDVGQVLNPNSAKATPTPDETSPEKVVSKDPCISLGTHHANRQKTQNFVPNRDKSYVPAGKTQKKTDLGGGAAKEYVGSHQLKRSEVSASYGSLKEQMMKLKELASAPTTSVTTNRLPPQTPSLIAEGNISNVILHPSGAITKPPTPTLNAIGNISSGVISNVISHTSVAISKPVSGLDHATNSKINTGNTNVGQKVEKNPENKFVTKMALMQHKLPAGRTTQLASAPDQTRNNNMSGQHATVIQANTSGMRVPGAASSSILDKLGNTNNNSCEIPKRSHPPSSTSNNSRPMVGGDTPKHTAPKQIVGNPNPLINDNRGSNGLQRGQLESWNESRSDQSVVTNSSAPSRPLITISTTVRDPFEKPCASTSSAMSNQRALASTATMGRSASTTPTNGTTINSSIERNPFLMGAPSSIPISNGLGTSVGGVKYLNQQFKPCDESNQEFDQKRNLTPSRKNTNGDTGNSTVVGNASLKNSVSAVQTIPKVNVMMSNPIEQGSTPRMNASVIQPTTSTSPNLEQSPEGPLMEPGPFLLEFTQQQTQLTGTRTNVDSPTELDDLEAAVAQLLDSDNVLAPPVTPDSSNSTQLKLNYVQISGSQVKTTPRPNTTKEVSLATTGKNQQQDVPELDAEAPPAIDPIMSKVQGTQLTLNNSISVFFHSTPGMTMSTTVSEIPLAPHFKPLKPSYHCDVCGNSFLDRGFFNDHFCDLD